MAFEASLAGPFLVLRVMSPQLTVVIVPFSPVATPATDHSQLSEQERDLARARTSVPPPGIV